MSETTTQVCQLHGAPDDDVICPKHNCQGGQIPMWFGYGAPAGVEICKVCNGKGVMQRKDAEEAMPLFMRQYPPPCICYWVKGTRR